MNVCASERAAAQQPRGRRARRREPSARVGRRAPAARTRGRRERRRRLVPSRPTRRRRPRAATATPERREATQPVPVALPAAWHGTGRSATTRGGSRYLCRTMAAVRTTAEIREGFLSFFEEKGHLRRPSASLDPARRRPLDALIDGGNAAADAVLPRPRAAAGAADDDGAEVLPHASTSTRSASTRIHLTFFEMLGNFSFGQYFKEGAIEFATEFIQRAAEARLGPDLGERPRRRPGAEARPRRGGDRPLGGDRDAARADRAAAVVRELLVGRRPRPVRARLRDLLRLGRGGRLRRAGLPARLRALRALPRVLEPRLHGVRAAARTARSPPLPKQNIDTGLGLERMARIVQDVAVASTTPTATS